MKNVIRKKPGPKPTGKGELIGVRLLPDLLEAVDEQKAATGARSRPEAIRKILADYLKRKGFLAKE